VRRIGATLLCAAVLAPALSSCALSYVDKNGDTHYQGLLVHVVIPKSSDQSAIRAESVRVQSFGLSLLTGPQRTNLTLGYNDDTLVLVRADSCVVLGSAPLSFGKVAAFDGNAIQGKDQHEK
jgi:hypothetical protein